jgi:hypothetical protein
MISFSLCAYVVLKFSPFRRYWRLRSEFDGFQIDGNAGDENLAAKHPARD